MRLMPITINSSADTTVVTVLQNMANDASNLSTGFSTNDWPPPR
ncbi:hypothetical protein [Actinokineospora spheciospongiae]|nr:hypothetical protein [Actinokineospora spheciospongiae]PWW63120.1 hypothetical protein DFQ13_104110 [Actinokineospora spheciospongiae]